MSSFTRLIGFALLLAVFAVVACDDDGKPSPPDPPPQIKVVQTFRFNPNPADTVTGLQSDSVFDILVDSQDRTWVATESGVSRFIDKQGDGVFNQNNVLPNPKCRALLEHNGKIWIGTWGGGVGIHDIGSDTWTKLNSDSGLVNDMVSDIAAVGDSVFIATNGGVSIYTDDDQLAMRDRWETIGDEPGELRMPLGMPLVSSVEIAHRPTRMEMWYGPRMEEMIPPGDEDLYGITVMREGLALPIYYTMVNSGLLEAFVTDIFYDEIADLFWVSFATKGLASVDVDGSTWSYYGTADGLPSEVVYSATVVDDVVWIGTQRGIAQKLNGTFQGYGRSGGLPSDRVRKVYSDTPSRLWAGFIDAGAARLDPNSAQTK